MHVQGDSPAPIVRAALATLSVLLLLAASMWVVLPFIAAILWAAIIAISAYPAFLRLTAAFKGRRKLAAIVICLVLAAVIFVPLVILVLTLGAHIGEAIAHIPDIDMKAFALPPPWLENMPLLGRRLSELWAKSASDASGTLESIRPRLRAGLLWLLPRIVSSTLILLEAAVAIVLSAFFLLTAGKLREFSRRLIERLGVEDSDSVLSTVEKTTRSVSRGIMGTALIQAMIAWVGFVIVGAPASVLLSFICLILCSIQLGIMIVGLPIAVWLWLDGRWESAIFIVAWSVFVSVIDNFLKPILLGRDFPAPIWILFLGIIGGLLSMGLIGLFIGPILLSISYQFIVRWAQT